jgi:hypothetical protein
MWTPWLIIGVIVGCVMGGCICAPTPYNHGPEDTLFQLQGNFWGAWIGLVVGLWIDIAKGLNRKK